MTDDAQMNWLKVTSDGTPHGTFVWIDETPILDVIDVSFKISALDPQITRATITFETRLDIDAAVTLTSDV
jgi:hypothetical protein